MARSYTIKDKEERTWGSFSVVREQYGMVYGRLVPTNEFEKVKDVFLEHEKRLSEPDFDGDETTRKIIELSAYLIDNENNEKIDIRNIIFINENLLVTCEIVN